MTLSAGKSIGESNVFTRSLSMRACRFFLMASMPTATTTMMLAPTTAGTVDEEVEATGVIEDIGAALVALTDLAAFCFFPGLDEEVVGESVGEVVGDEVVGELVGKRVGEQVGGGVGVTAGHSPGPSPMTLPGGPEHFPGVVSVLPDPPQLPCSAVHSQESVWQGLHLVRSSLGTYSWPQVAQTPLPPLIWSSPVHCCDGGMHVPGLLRSSTYCGPHVSQSQYWVC